MMEFIMMVFAVALGFLVAMGVAYAIMLQPKVLEWLMNKTMKASMDYVERMSEREDRDLY